MKEKQFFVGTRGSKFVDRHNKDNDDDRMASFYFDYEIY